MWLPICFNARQVPSEKVVYSLRKEFAPRESKFKSKPFQGGNKMLLSVFSP